MNLYTYILADTPLKATMNTYNVFFRSLTKNIHCRCFDFFDFSWEGERVVVSSPQIVINLPRTYEKLHCKEEPYRFSG